MGVEPLVGGVGDAYDKALSETIDGPLKAEIVHRRALWRLSEAVEFATLQWVDWFNTRLPLEPIGDVPFADAEACYYASVEVQALAA